ncbi:MAG TPA: BatA and WFA domain-containing protein [Anaerolineaceae bacterium]|nr:BatA and WFA domain-containing protein [Anaerolineaceae bacterium]
MSLLAPVFLLFGLLAAPILLLYMLKLRRRKAVISSNLLWQQILRDRQANTPWQRLKRNLFLFLQLLILAALVVALARPAIPVPSLTAGATVIVLDGSASMNATDVSPSRFEAARSRVRELIAGLPASTPVTLILAGQPARLLATAETGRAAQLAALQGAEPDPGPVDWEATFALAAGASSATGGAATTVIVSDGGVAAGRQVYLPGPVKYLPVGADGENLAVTALSVRPAEKGAQLFASVANYGSRSHTAILSVYAGERLIDVRQVSIAAGKSQDVVLSGLPGDAQGYTARLSSAQGGSDRLDGLSLDDAAFTVYRPAPGGRTLLVSPGNLYLRQLLESLPGVQSFSLLAKAGSEIQIPKDRYDVYVLDGRIPREVPPGNLLILNPPPNPFFSVGGTIQETGEAKVLPGLLTRFLKWDDVHILQARQVTLPDWAEPLVEAKGGPLVFTGETQGRRLAVVTFDLHESDLPLQVAYPILFSNLIQYLTHPANLSVLNGASGEAQLSLSGLAGETNVQVQPGGSILIRPAGGADQALVTDPDGTTVPVQLDQGQAVFSATCQAGIYTVSYPGHADRGQDAFAVTLNSPDESDIRPLGSLQIGGNSLSPQRETEIGQRELWPWLAALALVVLALEWWLYHRSRIFRANGQPGRGFLAGLRDRRRERG